MTEQKTTETQQSIPSVSWAWFHSGAVDLLISTVLVGIGLYSLLHQAVNPKESIIWFSIVVVIVIILQRVFDAKVQQKLFQRIPKENTKLDKMELFSEIAVFVILIGGLMLPKISGISTLPLMLSISSLLALLIGIINSIRVKYYYFLLIALIYCVLLIRTFVGSNLTVLIPTAWSNVRYLLVGLLFGAVSINKLVYFARKYPVIKE